MSNTKIKLKVDEPQDIKKISHQNNLFNLLLFEKILRVNRRERISKAEYVKSPAKESGSAVSLK